jgi:signal transduction histidine kinase
LQSGKSVWHARLSGAASHDESEKWLPGSRVRVAGICLIESTPSDATGVAPMLFRLLVRSPADVQLLRPPSWWTMERVQRGVALLLVAVAFAVAWVLVLRRRVRAQTGIIRQQLERETVHEERARIARELHDTLQQELIGIGLQLDVAAAQLGEAPESAQRSLERARNMIRHSQDEARQSIWDLRSRALETGGLVCALNDLLPSMAIGSRACLDIVCHGQPCRLPRWFETNLLRIAQEAVANALKHAAPEHIRVEMDYGKDALKLCVSDDGCGFSAPGSISINAGHFGLLGMRERAEKISARLELHSRPGEGTIICVTAPIPAAANSVLKEVRSA